MSTSWRMLSLRPTALSEGDNTIGGNVIAAHEEVVIFNGNGPVRREAKFKACSYGTAPASFGGLVPHDTGRQSLSRRSGGEDGAVFVVGDRTAALHVPEDVVPGIADLAGEEADGVDFGLVDGAVGNTRRQARIRPFQVSPIPLGFDAEHPVGGLPAIAKLTANQAAPRVVPTFRCRDNCPACLVGDGQAVVARRAATISPHIKTPPPVNPRAHPPPPA